MNQQIKKAQEEAKLVIDSAKTVKDLDGIYIQLFGKEGLISSLTKQIPMISEGDKPKFGQRINEVKREMESLLGKKRQSLRKRPKEFIDITAPGKKLSIGHLHPVSQAIEEIVAIFAKLGFSQASYPEIDWDWYAFESLNMPKNHPARDDWE